MSLFTKHFKSMKINTRESLSEKITKLKTEKNAIILAHYYQNREIQDIADYIGDSLALSKYAASTNAAIIVFSGVHFMSETAKILNPTKKVLLPDLNAGCSLSDSCGVDQFRKWRAKYPDYVAVTYINCSAEIKAESDIICTSANAEKIINSIPLNKNILFAPDKNLGKYLMNKTGRKLELWNGSCYVHEAFSLEKIKGLKVQYPKSELVVHPESETPLLAFADFIGSTSAMINYIKQSSSNEFIIATEAGILHQLMKEVPHKKLIPAPIVENNTCACSECSFMKLNTLEKLYHCLLHETPEILISKEIIDKSIIPLKRMLELSN
jgi:quinolinate synthase